MSERGAMLMMERQFCVQFSCEWKYVVNILTSISAGSHIRHRSQFCFRGVVPLGGPRTKS